MKINRVLYLFFIFFVTTSFIFNKKALHKKYNNCEFKDCIIMDKKKDSVLVNYFGKHKITYCEVIWLLANYKYLKNKSLNNYMYYNLHKLILPLENKTFIKGTYNVIGGWDGVSRFEYFIEDDLYKDLYKWVEKLDCVFKDETQLLININQDIQEHQKRQILFNDSINIPLEWIDTNFILPKKNIFNDGDKRKININDSIIYEPIKILYFNKPKEFNFKTIKSIEINDLDSIVKHINNIRLNYNIDPSLKKSIKIYFSDSSNQFQIQIKE